MNKVANFRFSHLPFLIPIVFICIKQSQQKESFLITIITESNFTNIFYL